MGSKLKNKKSSEEELEGISLRPTSRVQLNGKKPSKPDSEENIGSSTVKSIESSFIGTSTTKSAENNSRTTKDSLRKLQITSKTPESLKLKSAVDKINFESNADKLNAQNIKKHLEHFGVDEANKLQIASTPASKQRISKGDSIKLDATSEARSILSKSPVETTKNTQEKEEKVQKTSRMPTKQEEDDISKMKDIVLSDEVQLTEDAFDDNSSGTVLEVSNFLDENNNVTDIVPTLVDDNSNASELESPEKDKETSFETTDAITTSKDRNNDALSSLKPEELKDSQLVASTTFPVQSSTKFVAKLTKIHKNSKNEIKVKKNQKNSKKSETKPIDNELNVKKNEMKSKNNEKELMKKEKIKNDKKVKREAEEVIYIDSDENLDSAKILDLLAEREEETEAKKNNNNDNHEEIEKEEETEATNPKNIDNHEENIVKEDNRDGYPMFDIEFEHFKNTESKKDIEKTKNRQTKILKLTKNKENDEKKEEHQEKQKKNKTHSLKTEKKSKKDENIEKNLEDIQKTLLGIEKDFGKNLKQNIDFKDVLNNFYPVFIVSKKKD
ncbi:unnamed protein product [Bursaphelenchus okinawaensis]|uniref:Uncharacterized protein n=1 Tax=Bursaphelenchus okinawaensis TaxID=465554 RepID=A0A811KBD8_9BILA|nr:unnamed protein product [Bursaphelenchus okinawaensis]CAG9097284.1 unnamed protein product [Bursaphelenchus okinawaensis]